MIYNGHIGVKFIGGYLLPEWKRNYLIKRSKAMNNLAYLYNEVIDRSVGYVHTYSINTCRHAILIKMNSTTINLYMNSYTHTYSNPLMKLHKDYVMITGKVSSWHYKDLERHNLMMGICWRWERNGNIVTFKNVETMPFINMKVSYDSRLLVKIPKHVQKSYDDLVETNRQERNAYSRSHYHNKAAMLRLNQAEQTGDYNKYMKMDDVFKLHNVTDRRQVIAHFGMDTIIAGLTTKIVDKNTVGDNYYELVEVDLPDNRELTGYRTGTYLRMINPSTDEIHFEGVPNYEKPINSPRGRTAWRERIESKTVISALAWRNNNAKGRYVLPRRLT